ncbi:MAG: magnesium/cobalt transporter CorA [Chloroflexota bacterium]
MIRVLFHDGHQLHSLPAEAASMKLALTNVDGLLWVDFQASPPATDEPILRDVFGFHPLAIDDALQESHIPKIDDWEEYLYIVLHAIQFERIDGSSLETLELDIFVGRNYLVTHHDQPIAALNAVWEESQRDERHWKNGSDYLLYRLVDRVVTGYLPVLEEVDDEIERIENQVFSNPQPKLVERIFTLKRAIAHLRRVISPQREVLNKLARDDYTVIDRKARIYFRDVYDHLVRLHDISESIRDLVSGALDTYLSVINNRMNDIMKTLTIITTLFMPLSFVVGFFGMNFFPSPNGDFRIWTTHLVFRIAVLVLFLTPVGMYLWVKRKGWL